MKIKLSGWPWQYKENSAILDFNSKVKIGQKWGWKDPGGMGRFGGGWKWKLGITQGGSVTIIDLVYGSIWIEWRK